MTGPIISVLVLSGAVLLCVVLVKRNVSHYMSVMREDESDGSAAPRPHFRRFLVVRDDDVSGFSGEGVVCEGVQFSDDHAAIHWLGRYPMTTPHHEGVKTVEAIHGHGGKTRVVWLDEA